MKFEIFVCKNRSKELRLASRHWVNNFCETYTNCLSFKLPLQIVFATKELSLFHIRTQHNIMQSTSDEMHLCFKLEIGDNSKQMSERWEM